MAPLAVRPAAMPTAPLPVTEQLASKLRLRTLPESRLPTKPKYLREPETEVSMVPSALNTMPLMYKLRMVWPRPSIWPLNIQEVAEARP